MNVNPEVYDIIAKDVAARQLLGLPLPTGYIVPPSLLMTDDEDTIPADEDEAETPLPPQPKTAHPDDEKEVGVGVGEDDE